MKPRVASSILMAMLGGCSFAPDYLVPRTEIPDTFKENTVTDGWTGARPADAAPRGDWWTVFNDPILNTLEAEMTDANQDLKAAVARLDQARAAVDFAESSLFPLFGADASSTRERESHNRPLFGATSPSVYSDHIVSINSSYELDVWGRLRNAYDAAAASTEATAGDVQTLNLSLHAELASDYFQLREQDALIELFQQTVTAYKRALELTQQRYAGGIAAAVDVAQAQAQLQSTIAQQDDVRRARAQLEHAIALLVGEASSTFSLVPEPVSIVPPEIPVGLPSQLLERRPDIAAAERRVSAANSEIGVAIAAFYPVFDIDLSGGFESGKLANWVAAPSRFWSIGPSGTLNLFDAGQRSAVEAEAEAAYRETVADYRGTVLAAFRDTEDALAAIHTLDDEAIAQQNAAAAAEKAQTLANDRYTNGLSTYLEVVSAEATALNAQRAVADILTQRMVSRITLIRALGGLWGPSRPAGQAEVQHAD